MAKICIVLLLAMTLAALATGCKSTDPGSREYIPGKGWTPMPSGN